jgi:hypothetical protein
MQLSRFFTLAELTHSDTAKKKNIPNLPGETELVRLRALCSAVLDPLRESIGRAIGVNSAYRSPALNAAIGGVGRSQHVEGMAADVHAPGIDVLELFKTILRPGLPFNQVIYERKSPSNRWVHVSHDPSGNRGQILRAEFDSTGKATYHALTAAEALAMTEPAVRGMPGLESVEHTETDDAPAAPKRPVAKRRKPAGRGGRKTPAKAKRPATGKRPRKSATPAAAGARRRKPAAGAKKRAAKRPRRTAKKAARR